MADSLNDGQRVTGAVLRVARPDSIPGIENSTRVRAGPVTRSVTAKSRTESPTSLSPDGAELTDIANITEAKKEKGCSSADIFECAICLQTCVHPVQLPCSHIFCFLCIKGVAIQSKRCALCRQDIPVEFCNDPTLLRKEDLLREVSFEDGYQWYYQGMNGWWQYDERASTEIEENYKKGVKTLEMLIAGFLYIIDFENMLQYRRNDPTRRRKIKRDLVSIPDKKGVAGLKVMSPGASSPHRLDGDGGENVPCLVRQTRRNIGVRHRTPTAHRSVAPSLAITPETPNNTIEESIVSNPGHDMLSTGDAESEDLADNLSDLRLTPESPGQSDPHRQTRLMRSNVTQQKSDESSSDSDGVL